MGPPRGTRTSSRKSMINSTKVTRATETVFVWKTNAAAFLHLRLREDLGGAERGC